MNSIPSRLEKKNSSRKKMKVDNVKTEIS